MQKSQAQWRGREADAVLSRLQAPTGKAWDALKELGVKTSDSKGNTRPIFTILKEMQASFEKNRLGTAQQAEYMKTIFGEEASSAAAVLMTAASTGKLDKLTAAFKASDGKTAELVNIMQDNLGGDFKEFQSAYEAVGTDLFDQQEGALRKLTQTATKYVLKLDGWIQKNKSLASTIGIIAGGALALNWHHRCHWPCSLAGYHRHQCHHRGSRRNGGNLHDGWQCRYDGHRGD